MISTLDAPKSILKTSKAYEREQEERTFASDLSLVSGKPARTTRTQFGCVQVLCFDTVPGDNPCTLSGPPVSLGWTSVDRISFDSPDDFEKLESIPAAMETTPSNNSPDDEKKMTPRPTRLPSTIRVDRLRKRGFTRSEIQRAQKLATIARNRRKRTIENLQNAAREEKLEDLRRTLTCSRVVEPLSYPITVVDRDGRRKTVMSSSLSTAAMEGDTPSKEMFSTSPCPECSIHAALDDEDGKCRTNMYQPHSHSH